ncbi:MAG: TraB/GumN family protein [Roseivirga sp.]|nr:TraB/GumN family protein [Roseivirga sp.]
MKNLSILLPLLFLNFNLDGYQNDRQEVLIIGTMHDVPKIVKHSYKPLLRIARRYGPDAIYVERQRPDDSLSLANYESKWFLPLGDSLRRTFKQDCDRFDQLMASSIQTMSHDDFGFLRNYFAVNRDKANWSYYQYLAKYGLNGSRKPTRNENGDLTARLAIAMDMNRVFAMDHQHEAKLYTKLWRECIIASRKDGQVKRLTRHNKRSYNRAILPAIFGRLGKHTNRSKTIRSYEVSNRFTFRETPCEPCDAAGAVWDRRNAGMAKNIGEQMQEFSHKKAVVIVGAGHVLGIKAALEAQFPEIRVRILEDL